jgi:hypothetical protein
MRTWLMLIPLTSALVASTAAAATPAAPVTAPAAAPAAAPPGPDKATPPATGASTKGDRGAFVVGAMGGAIVPWNGLGANAVADLQIGYVLPFLRRSFGLLVDVSYSVPKTAGNQGDVRVTSGGAYDWHITHQQLTITPHLSYRIPYFGRVVPFVGIGPRIYLDKSTVEGAAGSASVSPTIEQSTKVGFGVPVGADIKLGPGAIIAEALFEWGRIDHTATGTASSAGSSFQLGYHFLL